MSQRRRGIGFAMAILSIVAACENGTIIESGEDEGGTPVCRVLPGELDFGYGVLDEGSTASVTLRNLGGGTLNARLNLADSTGAFELLGGRVFTVGGGNSRPVTLRFTPTSRDTFRAELDIGIGCESVSVVGIGDFAPVCVVDPQTVTEGTIALGSVRVYTVTISNDGGGRLQGIARPSCPDLTIVSGGTFDIAAGESHRMRVALAPEAAGPIECELDLGTRCDPVTFSGTGQFVPGCIAVTPLVEFGAVEVGGVSVRSTVTYTNTDTAPVSGTIGIDCPDGSFRIVSGGGAYTIPPDGTHAVVVEYAPAAGTCGPQSCELTSTLSTCAQVVLSGTARVTFDDHIGSIFTLADQGCVNCHSFEDADVVRSVVNFDDPEASRLLNRPLEGGHTGGVFPCFQSGSRCREQILCWIRDGAPD